MTSPLASSALPTASSAASPSPPPPTAPPAAVSAVSASQENLAAAEEESLRTVVLVGHVVSALLGLALGYLILHIMRPETFPLPW